MWRIRFSNIIRACDESIDVLEEDKKKTNKVGHRLRRTVF